jgi:hypothetical protein
LPATVASYYYLRWGLGNFLHRLALKYNLDLSLPST